MHPCLNFVVQVHLIKPSTEYMYMHVQVHFIVNKEKMDPSYCTLRRGCMLKYRVCLMEVSLYLIVSNLPTQSNLHPVLQHFSPDGQELSFVQRISTSSGHSAGFSKTGHIRWR